MTAGNLPVKSGSEECGSDGNGTIDTAATGPDNGSNGSTEAEGELRFIDIHQIDRNPEHVRSTPRSAAFEENRRSSIRKDGVKVPLLVVRKADGRYKVIDGHGRLKDCWALIGELTLEEAMAKGLFNLPCRIVPERTPVEELKDQLVTNDTQERLSATDRASTLKRIMELSGEKNQIEIAEEIGCCAATVSNVLKLANHPELLARVEAGELTPTKAISLTRKKRTATKNTKPKKKSKKQGKNGKEDSPAEMLLESVLLERADKKLDVRLVIYGPKNTPRENYAPFVRNVMAEIVEEKTR